MNRRIIAVAAGFAAMTLAGVQPARASQCTNTCDQAYMTCDKGGAQDCLPKWGQCKRTCSAPSTTPIKATQPVSIKPTPKPKS